MSQDQHDGFVTVITGTEKETDSIYTISPGDMITLLNWCRYAKRNELPLFPDEDRKSPCLSCESTDCAYNKNGICKLSCIMDHQPEITDENGCEEYLYRNEREEN